MWRFLLIFSCRKCHMELAQERRLKIETRQSLQKSVSIFLILLARGTEQKIPFAWPPFSY